LFSTGTFGTRSGEHYTLGLAVAGAPRMLAPARAGPERGGHCGKCSAALKCADVGGAAPPPPPPLPGVERPATASAGRAQWMRDAARRAPAAAPTSAPPRPACDAPHSWRQTKLPPGESRGHPPLMVFEGWGWGSKENTGVPIIYY